MQQPQQWDMREPIKVPQHQLPVFRTQMAVIRGVEKNVLFRTWGGIGDQICAEPTLRYALRMFKTAELSLASELPGMFKHLQFKRVFDLEEESPNYNKYLLLDTITSPDETNLVWMFFSHLLTNCVDFPSLCSIRSMLPIADKEIKLTGIKPQLENLQQILDNGVLIHPGKHWQIKTFPKPFWDQTIKRVRSSGKLPIIMGANADDNRGTVDIDPKCCVDLRNKLSIQESIWLCQNMKVLLTNDSAPLHMAASGGAWIGYVATVKHPDMITHWRHGQFQWREVNFGKGGIWDEVDYCPNQKQTVTTESVDMAMLESWLPDPNEFADWALEKVGL